MSLPTKDLQEVYKNAPTVTSLASTDRILIAESNGIPKKISKGNLLSNTFDVTCKDAGWVRIMSFNVAGDAIIAISNGYSSLRGGMVLFAPLMHATANLCNLATLANIGNNSASSSFTKVRMLSKTSSEGYLDFYYPGSTGSQNVIIQCLASRNCTLLAPEVNATIPDGYTAQEFNLTVVGGVNRYSLASYAILPKGGGLRNGYWYKRPLKLAAAECCDAPSCDERDIERGKDTCIQVHRNNNGRRWRRLEQSVRIAGSSLCLSDENRDNKRSSRLQPEWRVYGFIRPHSRPRHSDNSPDVQRHRNILPQFGSRNLADLEEIDFAGCSSHLVSERRAA